MTERPQAGRRIVNNMLWLGLQEGLSRLIGFALVVLLARMLSPQTLGSLNICLALVALLTILVSAGTGSRGTRLTARAPANIADLYPQITGFRVLVTAVAVGAIAVASDPLAKLLSVPRSLLLLSMALLLQPALTVAWAFRGLDDMRTIAVASVVERLIVIVGVILLFGREDLGGEPIVLLETAGAVFVVLFLRWRLGRRVDIPLFFRPQPSRWRAMFRESVPIGFAALTASVYRHGDLLLAGILAGSDTAARFLIPLKITLTLLVLPVLIGRASFPSICREIHQDPRRAAVLQERLLRLTLLALLPACVAIGYFGQPLLTLLFGATYGEEARALSVLLLSAPFFAFGVFQENLLLAVPRPRTVLACRVIAAGGHLLVSMLLIPRFGAAGAAVGCLVGQILFAGSSAWAWHRATKQLPLSRRTLVAPLGALLMGPVLHYGTSLLGAPAGLVIAGCSYLVVMLACGELAALQLGEGLRLLLPVARGTRPR